MGRLAVMMLYICLASGFLAGEKGEKLTEIVVNWQEQEQEESAMWEEAIGCDSVKAQKAARIFQKAVGCSAESLEKLSAEGKGKTVKAVTQGKEYYLKITETGSVREIREGSLDGKILFQVNY